jgi:hypothetical protein
MISRKKKIFLVLLPIIVFIQPINSQSLVINWQQCYGGSDQDGGTAIAHVANNFYLFCTTNSVDGNVISNHGLNDFWVIKTNLNGQIIWAKTYGGSNYDNLSQMKPTTYGGFVIIGSTESNDGNVLGNHGTSDYWVLGIDSLGIIQWQKCFGGSLGEVAADIDLTGNSGFICQGYSNSIDGQVTGNHGNFDYWVVKFDNQGNIIWSNSYGGSMADFGLSITSTHDGGAILGGWVSLADGDVQCSFHGGNSDAWLVKLDSNGAIQWQQCYGGSKNDDIYRIIELYNGDYLCTGNTTSDDGEVSGNHGINDFWILKIDHNGNIMNQKCFGGSGVDVPNCIKALSDGNFLLGGYTYSNDGDVSGNHSDNGFSDMWLIKITPDLDLIWQQCIGGDRDEQCADLLDLGSGNYILTGYTSTTDNSGNVNVYNHGSDDVWLLSVKDTTYNGIQDIDKSKYMVTVYPNPASQVINFQYRLPSLISAQILIVNIFGEPIEDITLNDHEGIKSWNIEGITPGMYYYFFTELSILFSGKIVILGSALR